MSAVVVYVTRDELSLADLTLTDYANGYEVVEDSLNAGQVSWRRSLVRSPFVDGAYETNAVRELVEGGTIAVDVNAANQTTLQSRVTTLINAFSQSTYELHVTLDGIEWAWTCMRADYAVGVASDDIRFGLTAPVAFQFPRQPVPVNGPY